MPPSGVETRRKLVDAAARAFAEQGVFEASLIDITRRAGQRNRAAIHYHFKSREGAVCAVLDRHVELLHRREGELLAMARDTPSEAVVPVVEAIVRPAVEVAETGWRGRCSLVILAQLVEEDPATLAPEVKAVLARTGGYEVYALLAEAQLSEVGLLAVPSTIVAALANRLKIVAWAQAHPEVAEERIEAPLVVIGMFRAGTTFLSNLLDQDPANRSLLRWEAADSVPPPTPASHRQGPRVDEARVGVEMLEAMNPAMRAIHHEDADGPTECISIMSQDFKSLSWEAITNVPSYAAWLRAVDQRSAYAYHRQVLQVLQSGGVRGRWTLKSPHHALALDALTAVYPDARLVMLHRDPAVLAASVCSLVSTLTGTFSDADHTAYIAEHWTAMLEDCVARTDAFRTAHPEHPITDVLYADLVLDPAGTVEAIDAAVGRELSGGAREALAAYLRERPRHPFGTHGYDLASHGLDGAELADRFGSYIERFAIPSEEPRS